MVVRELEPHELDALVESVDNPSAPSTTKFNHVRDWIAEVADLRPEKVGVYWISKPGNLGVRLRQPGLLSRKPTLVLAILAQHEDLERTVPPGQRLVGQETHLGTLALCSRTPSGRWEITTVIEPPGDRPITRRLRALFPGIAVESPLGTPQDEASGQTNQPEVEGDVADELFLAQDWVDEVLWLLEDRRGIVFYGPPGTGKTYIARRLALHLQPDAQRRRLIQLHPSYGYEDFFEGYRPDATAGGDGMRLVKRPGPLRELANLAAESGEPALLIIDEINRGNLPRVFGELFFLLEYREESARLMYSPEEVFSLPSNLYLIGTMNTADRSIAILDQALRRRFHFIPLFPGEPPVDGMMRGFLDRYRPGMLWVVDLIAEVNRRLGDRNIALGPSHFMRKDLDEEILARIWRHSVIPIIEDHFFGQEERIQEFDLAALRNHLETAPVKSNDIGNEQEDANSS